MNKAIIIVLDSLGVGELPDAELYGDQGSNTLGNIAKAIGGINLPNLEKMGIGNLTEIRGVRARVDTLGLWEMAEQSGKGYHHRTLGNYGGNFTDPMPTFPEGFPEIIDEFEKLIGRKTLGNEVASEQKS